MTGPREAALAYAAYGWHVFPLHGITDGRCTCGRTRDDGCSPGKHPRTHNGLKDASTNPLTVGRWWAWWPEANIGIRTGAVSNLLVVDIDPAHGGGASLARLEAQHGALLTREAETGSGGAHLYFQHPGGELGNSAGRLGAGLDTRCDGGYVVGPPSLHVSGRPYRWCTATKRILPAPAWLLALLRQPERPPRTVRLPDRTPRSAYWLAALEAEAQAVADAPQGTRNHSLNTAAFSLGQLIATHGAPLEQIRAVLIDAGVAAGLSETETTHTVDSGLEGGRKHPRGAA